MKFSVFSLVAAVGRHLRGPGPVGRRLAAAVLVATAAAAQVAPAIAQTETEALDFTSLGSGFDYTQGSYSLGWRFTTNQDVTVTALGFYDDLKNGLAGPHPVGIYDVQTQQLLCSGTVNPSDPLTGFFRYASIAPCVLKAGRDYYAVAVTSQDHYAVDVSNLAVDPAITFVGFACNYGSSTATALTFPDPASDIPGAHGDFGPSFKLTAATTTPPPPTASPNVAVDFSASVTDKQGNSCLGWRFTTNQEVVVASLGYYAAGGGKFAQSHAVGIYNSITTTLITVAQVTNDDPLRGLFRYHAIGPVHLPANGDYFIVGLTGTDPYAVDVANQRINPAINFFGDAFNGDPTVSTLAFPDHATPGTAGLFGPNFETLDPNAATPTVTLSVDQPVISRQANQVATVTISRTGGDLSADLKVSYAVGGALLGGQDYAVLSGVKKIPAGQTSALLRIAPLAGGANGKVSVKLLARKRYVVGSAGKVKVKVTK